MAEVRSAAASPAHTRAARATKAAARPTSRGVTWVRSPWWSMTRATMVASSTAWTMISPWPARRPPPRPPDSAGSPPPGRPGAGRSVRPEPFRAGSPAHRRRPGRRRGASGRGPGDRGPGDRGEAEDRDTRHHVTPSPGGGPAGRAARRLRCRHVRPRGYTRSTFTAEGKTQAVYRPVLGPGGARHLRGSGHHPQGRGVRPAGGRPGPDRVLPHLFGQDGASCPSAGAMAKTMASVCVSRQFTLLALGKTSPVVSWLRCLAQAEHERCPGPGVGVVGMCLTGGLRPGDDGRRLGRGPGAQPAVAAAAHRPGPVGRPRHL